MAPREAPAALAERLGLPPAPWLALLAYCGVDDPEAWVAAGQERLGALGPGPGSEALRWGLWLPLYSRVHQLLAQGQRLVLGVNGPIGAGKSTLMATLLRWGAAEGLPLAVASIDDAYLGWHQRQSQLAGNPFGVWRGPPGSHDVAMLLERLARWQDGGDLVLPRFDKRLRQGQGDRSGEWCGAPQLLVLEGWLLGCRPLSPARLQAAAREQTLPERGIAGALPGLQLRSEERAWLPIWNQRLETYQPLWERLAGLWLLRPSCWLWPRRWRLQAEARQRRRARSAGGAGPVTESLGGDDLERLVRACLLSLPPQLYQDPLVQAPGLIGTADPVPPRAACAEVKQCAEAVAVLNSRRNCLWSGPGAWFPGSDALALNRSP